MIDPYGRAITYLRLSVFDRCDLRCLYCMAENTTFLPKAEVLSLEEMDRLAGAFITLGVRKIRLTGGEPLVRRGITTLIERLGRKRAAGRLDELTLTTNGTLLARHAEALAAAGMRRINVSLDSLDPDLFHRITRLGRVETVLEGIRAARAAGLAVKINTVALRGLNEDGIDRLIAWCGETGCDMTLIEAMPLGDFPNALRGCELPLSELRRRLETRWTLRPTSYVSGGPARYVEVAETGRRLGFITPLSGNFCDGCNRVRVSCTGALNPCLGREGAVDLRAALRGSKSDLAVQQAILAALRHKPQGHDFLNPGYQPPPSRCSMNAIGG